MWTKNYAHCIRCEQTDAQHMSEGLCKKCYMKDYLSIYRTKPENIKRAKVSKHNWYLENVKGTGKDKIAGENNWFDGNREPALIRDNHQCVRCCSSKQLIVHHIDRQGRNKEIRNNDLSNLETLCKACHIEEHRQELHKAKGVGYYWCPSLKLQQCVECGLSTHKHTGRGKCKRCYSREQARRLRKSKSLRYSPNLQATVRDEQK